MRSPVHCATHHHRAVRLREMLEHLEELSHFEDLGPLQSLACVLDAHQRDRVLANFNDSPSLRTLQDQVHQAPYMNLRLRSKRQIAQL